MGGRSCVFVGISHRHEQQRKKRGGGGLFAVDSDGWRYFPLASIMALLFFFVSVSVAIASCLFSLTDVVTPLMHSGDSDDTFDGPSFPPLPLFVTFAVARPRRRGGGGGLGGPPPTPPVFTVPAYSLSSACADEIAKWCLFRTPYTIEAIHCFEAHRSELSKTCRKWHDARISCQSQIDARARGAAEAKAGGGGDRSENEVGDAEADAAARQRREAEEDRHRRKPPQRRADVGGDGDDGAPLFGREAERVDDAEVALVNNGGIAPPPPRRDVQANTKKECGDICQQYCGESKSLLLCMRVLGRSIRSVTDASCYDTDFARSIVRSLNLK